MTENPEPQGTVSDTVAHRVRELREGRDWSGARLAEECAKAGYPQLTAEVIGNIERGRRDSGGRRRRDVTVDELFAFARVFGLSPGFLLAEWFNDRDTAHTFLHELDRLSDQLSRAQEIL